MSASSPTPPTFLGWRMHGTKGGIAAGAMFVLPSMLILFALAWLAMIGGGFAWLDALFLGLMAAVIAIVAQQAVETHGWLSHPQMMTGLALAESTPGPLIMVLQLKYFKEPGLLMRRVGYGACGIWGVPSDR